MLPIALLSRRIMLAGLVSAGLATTLVPAEAAGDKSPMYKPFVANIASVEKVDDRTVRFKLKAPNASFFTSTLAKINLIPKHVWEPILTGPQLQGKTAESYQEQ